MKLFRLISLLLIASLQQKTFAMDLQKELHEFKDGYLKTHHLNAIYAVYQNKEPLLVGASGFAYKKLEGDTSGRPERLLESQDKMPLASGTKQFTAAAILKLQERGALNVHDVISSHLPTSVWGENIPDWANKITIHQLLTHTAGIADYVMAIRLDLTKPHKEINKEILSFAAKTPLLNTPGKEFKYGNTGYVILGMIIENVSGISLKDFYHNEFFIPLGMSETYLSDLQEAKNYQDGKLADTYPMRYFLIPGSAEPIFSPVNLPIQLPAYSDGGLVSSIKDLNIWMDALFNGKVLSDKSLDLMTTKHTPGQSFSYGDTHYGYGIYIAELNGKTIYAHGANAIGIRGEFSYIPSTKTSAFILSNSMVHEPEQLKGKIDYKLDQNQLDIIFFNTGLISLLCK